jgi:hypothetical protein
MTVGSCSKILEASTVINLWRPPQDFKEYSCLPPMPQVPLGVLDHTEKTEQQPRPVAEFAPILGLWAVITHQGEIPPHVH